MACDFIAPSVFCAARSTRSFPERRRPRHRRRSRDRIRGSCRAGAAVNDLQRRIGAPRAIDQARARRAKPWRRPRSSCKKICRRVSAPPETRPKALSSAALGQFADLAFDMQPGLVPDQRDMGRLGALGQRHDRRRVTLNAGIARPRIPRRTTPALRRREQSPCANRPNRRRSPSARWTIAIGSAIFASRATVIAQPARAQRLVERSQRDRRRCATSAAPSATATPAGSGSESSAMKCPPSRTSCAPRKRSRAGEPARAASISARVGRAAGSAPRPPSPRANPYSARPRPAGSASPRSAKRANAALRTGDELPPFLLRELLREGRFRRSIEMTHMDGHRRSHAASSA